MTSSRRTKAAVGALGGLVALGVTCSGRVSRRLRGSLRRPLRELEAAARRAGMGDLSFRLPVDGRSELGQVAEAFNTMAERLERSQDELSHQALHDSLTGLPNRALFEDRNIHAVTRARRSGVPVAVLLLDLDDFKSVNCTMGHPVGDRLIALVAERLAGAVREGDTVARLGGDEFAVLLDHLDDVSDAAEVGERLLAALRAPFSPDGHQMSLPITASVGIAVTTAGRDDAHALLRHADVAMYAAKAGGKARCAAFEPSMHAAALQRRALEVDLQQALSNGELHILYQPVVEVSSGKLVGAEALLRWRHPTRGLVVPAEFIPVAERTGLIVPIGGWVLREACRELARLTTSSPLSPVLSVSVNLSIRQLRQPDLVDDVDRALRDAHVDPDRLTLEITESVLMEDVEATIGRLQELKSLGVRLAVDDFGTGYSSLGYLRRLPVDILKVDKMFIDGLGPGSDEDASLARVVVTLGRTLRMKTVAEGVERADQIGELRALGCELGQGYHWAAPMTASALEALVEANEPVAVVLPARPTPKSLTAVGAG